MAQGDSRVHLCSTVSSKKHQAAQHVSPSRLSCWLALAALQHVGCLVLRGGLCLLGLGIPAHEGATFFPETGLSRAQASCLAGSQSRRAAPPLSRLVLSELLVLPGPGLSAQGLSICAELQSSAQSLVTHSSLLLWETPVRLSSELWLRAVCCCLSQAPLEVLRAVQPVFQAEGWLWSMDFMQEREVRVGVGQRGCAGAKENPEQVQVRIRNNSVMLDFK